MQTFRYIYKTTNLTNGLIYIGKHTNHKTSFNTEYFGSGYQICNAIKEIGVENFSCEPIFYTFDNDTLNEYERYFIAFYNARDPKVGYNVHRGGNGFSLTKHRPETIEKLKRNHVSNNTPECNARRSVKLKGRKHSPERKKNQAIASKKTYESSPSEQIKCKNCNEIFSRKIRSPHHAFCCEDCKKEFNKKPPKLFTQICKYCENTFVFRSVIREFCSSKCESLYNNIQSICEGCGKPFIQHGKHIKTCSSECAKIKIKLLSCKKCGTLYRGSECSSFCKSCRIKVKIGVKHKERQNIEHICEYCNQFFISKSKCSRYCSKECWKIDYKNKRLK